MAMLSILYAACYGCSGVTEMPDEELDAIGKHLMALMIVKASYLPESDIIGQVTKSISKKLKFTNRPRPSAIQLFTAFSRIVSHKKGSGDKRPTSTILAQTVVQYNSKQTSNGKISTDERDAVLMLQEQLPAFIETLSAHWLNFPVKCSGVPTSFLSSRFLTGTYEPPLKKKETPKHYEMARSTPEKNLEWLRRCIGKYLKEYKEAKEKGAISIDSMGSVFRDGNSDETLYHGIGIFCTFKDEFKKNLTDAAWIQVLEKFYRGGLDRELLEKARSKDESVEVMDFRFVQGAQGYDPTSVSVPQAVVASEAREKKFESDLRLDELNLQEEEQAWDEHLRKLRAFHATDQNAKTDHSEALDDAWSGAADKHIASLFPTSQLKSYNELTMSFNTVVNSYCDFIEVLQGDVFRVLVFNLSYLGPEHTKLVDDMKSTITAFIALDDAKTCALVIAPTVANYKQTYDEEALDKVTQHIFDSLRDGPTKVREVILYFNPKTQWSKTRRHSHKAYMCISKKVADKKMVSKFVNSELWLRGSCEDMITVMSRAEIVDPTWTMAVADRGNLGDAQETQPPGPLLYTLLVTFCMYIHRCIFPGLVQERKQWITGMSLYTQLGEALWQGMGLNPKFSAAWLDAIAYDATLPLAVIARSGVPGITFPREMVASFIWNGTTVSKKATENFINKTIRNNIKSKCRAKEYIIQGAPDISESSSGVSVRVAPTYDEKSFQLTKPMADKSLPLRKTFVDKWHGTDIPRKFKDLFDATMVKHDAKYNKSGIPFAGEVSKRKAEDAAVGDGAKTLTPEPDAPRTRDQVEEKHGSVKVKFLQHNPKSQLLVADDGAIYVETGDEDELLLAENALHTYAGEYHTGKEFEKKSKDGATNPTHPNPNVPQANL